MQKIHIRQAVRACWVSLCVLLVLAAVGCVTKREITRAQDAAPWLPSEPDDISPIQGEALPEEKFYEVSVSNFDSAEWELKDQIIIPLSLPANYGRKDFRCSSGEKQYLARALYGNGGTGVFTVLWVNDALVIAHASLGAPPRPLPRSALVVCLSHAPAHVYSAVSGAL